MCKEDKTGQTFKNLKIGAAIAGKLCSLILLVKGCAW